MIRIFYIDKDPQYYSDLCSWLPDSCELIAIPFHNIEKTIDQLDCARDIVLVNPDYTGGNVDLQKKLIEKIKSVPLIYISETVNLQQIVDYIKIGAYTFLHKQKDKSLIIDSIKNIIYSEPSSHEKESCSNRLDSIIGTSESINSIKNSITSLKDKDLSIHLTGETGTGKELAAQALHEKLIPINCGAIPENLFESEFFGTKKGAYTDAVEKVGIFERAHGATIFLDEIGELSKSAQIKLLRVLENGTFSKVGDSKELYSDFRLVSASNRNLKEEVKNGNFREDLYYRITSFIIEIPPLRERKEDIVELSKHFLNNQDPLKNFSDEAICKLLDHKWPGNVRELKQTILRADHLSGLNREIAERDILIY